ncbi:16S rRNA (cytosine(1402)-N(4))-methyltransferase RsmH [Puteibacter caeruleilacunae]|nr:16S rRNA (cytosine(1402)-N(4))-methyltransferase RsmH [Puteibacter caeruleilacunae]
MSEYHKPVLLVESVDGLVNDPNGVYVDVTFGGGGHSREILSRLGEGRLYGFDQDEDVLDNIPNDDRFHFVRHNFRFLKNFLRYFKEDKVDGVLADLGVSSHDFDVAERGFSFRFDARLDMRMNQKATKDAAWVINNLEEDRLIRIFREFGEIKNARKLVGLIAAARQQRKIDTTTAFLEIIEAAVPKNAEKKYLAKVFQALRIEVNNELDVLKDFLEHAKDVLKPGGRLVVITYHSLEDRLVKNFMKSGNFEGKQEKDFFGNVDSPFKIITRKIIIPSDDEIEENPRARSAKLRIAELK